MAYGPPPMELGELRITMTCNLPGDIMITNILPRLPIKTLFRNKIINKTWYALIENPEFQQMQFDMTSPDQEDCHYVVQREFSAIYIYIVNPKSNACAKTDIVHGGRMRVAIGSVNGVFCFTSERPDGFGYIFILHNPIYRREYLEVELNNRVLKGYVSLGFGYDSRKKDFKIVRIEQHELIGQVRTICDLYSSNTGSWRTFEPKIDGLLTERTSWANVNGALHWLAKRGKYLSFIVSFDLSEEVFGEILLPRRAPDTCLQIHVWKDHLAAIYYYVNQITKNESFEIWMMAEYGSRESWTWVRRYGPFPSGCVLRGSTTNGQSLMLLFNSGTNKLVLYDPHTHRDGLDRDVAIEKVEAELSSSRLDVLNYRVSMIKVKGSKKFDYWKAFLHWICPMAEFIFCLFVLILFLWIMDQIFAGV